jgi:phytol kinase
MVYNNCSMMILLLTSLAVFVILLLNEWWWRGRTHGEISRKFVHITVGTFVAMWPLYLTWDQIRLLGVLFVVVVLISQRLNVFKAIHSVQRPTLGEICFGASVGILTFLTHSPAIYAVALLHMSLADGLAAIVGVKYGNGSAFTFLGAKKSLPGSLTFLVVSLALLACYGMVRGIGFPLYFVPLSLGMTALEVIAIRGLDNVAIQLVLAAVLHL